MTRRGDDPFGVAAGSNLPSWTSAGRMRIVPPSLMSARLALTTPKHQPADTGAQAFVEAKATKPNTRS